MSQVSAGEQQILEILKRRGHLSNMAAKCLQGFMEKWNVDAYRATVETHCVEESRLAEILADEFHLTRVSRLRSRPVSKDALSFVSYHDAMNFDIIAYAIGADNDLQVAIADPTRLEVIETLLSSSQKKIVFHVAERSEIEASIQRHYPLSMQLPITMQAYGQQET